MLGAAAAPRAPAVPPPSHWPRPSAPLRRQACQEAYALANSSGATSDELNALLWSQLTFGLAYDSYCFRDGDTTLGAVCDQHGPAHYAEHVVINLERAFLYLYTLVPVALLVAQMLPIMQVGFEPSPRRPLRAVTTGPHAQARAELQP